MTPTDVLAIQRVIDQGHMHLVQRVTKWGYGNYLFTVPEITAIDLCFEFFCDAGDWDYLSKVIVNGEVIADYDKLNNLTESDWQDSWRDVGKWMPNLPRWTELKSLEET